MFIFKAVYKEKEQEMHLQNQQKMEDPFQKTSGKMYEAPKDLKALTPSQLQKNLNNSIVEEKNQVNYFTSSPFEVNGSRLLAGGLIGLTGAAMFMTSLAPVIPLAVLGVGALILGIGLLEKPIGNILTDLTKPFYQSTEKGYQEHATLIMASSIAGNKDQREEYAGIFKDYMGGKIKTKENLYAQIGSIYMGGDYSASADSKVMQSWILTGKGLLKDAENSFSKYQIKVTPSTVSECTMDVSTKIPDGVRITTVKFVPPEYVSKINGLIASVFNGVKPLVSDKPPVGVVASGRNEFIPDFSVTVR